MEKHIRSVVHWLLHPPAAAPPATVLIRLMAGSVFFWEGVMKFVFPATLGVGRFTKLGIPFPDAMATFVGGLEIVGGLLLIAGLLTRVIAVPLLIDMVVAVATTKIPLYLGTYPLAPPPVPPQFGFWAVLHEIRSDEAQFLCTAFLLLVGAGPWALDAVLARPRAVEHPQRSEPALGHALGT
jgi:putative oxidoreductase